MIFPLAQLEKPEFYTFYNGREKEAKERLMRLSDAYEERNTENGLEVTVKMININRDAHHEILEKCPVLNEYSQFIETIRKYQDRQEERPYKKAIQECIGKGILKDYLMRRGSEVENMLLAEYDYETDIAVQREEAWEEGMEKGIEKGIVKRNREIACNLAAKGMPIKEIAQIVNAKEAEVKEWIEEKK